MKTAQEAIAYVKAFCGHPENRNGNMLYRWCDPRYDARDMYASWMTEAQGWKEYHAHSDTAFYHEKEHVFFEFNEGDVALIQCPNDSSFKAELQRWDRFFKEA